MRGDGGPARVMVIFGTRPEAIKVAPIIRALEASPLFEPIIVVTAQHRQMLDDVLASFSITPNFDLDIIEERQRLADVVARTLTRLSPVLDSAAPDVAIVQGDTGTTFAGALAAFYQGVPVVHVEAGLRTHDARTPFPEEANRRLTAQLTDLHLAATESSKANLLDEGVEEASIVVTGNTVIDALLAAETRGNAYSDPALRDVDEDPRRLLLVTAHRRESWGMRLSEIGRAVAEIARAEPELLVVVPIHRNPVVRQSLAPAVHAVPNVRVVEPLPYGSFVRLMRRAHLILTDSGGVQEEAPSLGTPVLVLRNVTERVEALAVGSAKLVGTNRREIVGAVREVLHDDVLHRQMAAQVNPYGDGRAAARCVDAIAHLVGVGPPPDEFSSRGPGPRPFATAVSRESESDGTPAILGA
jgi:UDP-N-acetylglucosamine 2-epimerase (non-hydrolysing)